MAGDRPKVIAIDEGISVFSVYGIRSGRRWGHVV